MWHGRGMGVWHRSAPEEIWGRIPWAQSAPEVLYNIKPLIEFVKVISMNLQTNVLMD